MLLAHSAKSLSCPAICPPVGNTDVKGMTEDVKKMREDFIKAQTTELVDPIGALNEIQAMNDSVEAFMTNVDACLSVSNAVTVIEISY